MATIGNIELSFQGLTTQSDALPENSLKALLVLGYTTKLKNVTAGLAAAMQHTGKNDKAFWEESDYTEAAEQFGLLSVLSEHGTTSNEFVAAVADAMRREMFDAILNGVEPTSSRGRKPKMSEDDKLRESITHELLVAYAKNKGMTLPTKTKEKEEYAKLFDMAAAKWADTIEKEFKTRKAKVAKFDLADLDA